MTAYEIIINVLPALTNLKNTGFDIPFIDNLTMVEEYLMLKNKGEKKTFIISKLSLKYNKSERSVQRILNMFQRNVKITS